MSNTVDWYRKGVNDASQGRYDPRLHVFDTITDLTNDSIAENHQYHLGYFFGKGRFDRIGGHKYDPPRMDILSRLSKDNRQKHKQYTEAYVRGWEGASDLAANAQKKEDLIATAVRMAGASICRESNEGMKALFDEWKKIGPAGQEKDHDLFERFTQARQPYYDRRKKFYAERDKNRERSKDRKQTLIHEQRCLNRSAIEKNAREQFNTLMDEWKAAGSAGHEDNELWQEFLALREEFKQRRADHSQERKDALSDTLDRKRQRYQNLSASVAHDRSLIDRWQEKRANIRPGGRADELYDMYTEKMDSVGEKIRSKEETLRELEHAIDDIERKL